MPLSDEPPDYLHRLPKEWYTGHAWVHWSMTIDGRKRGWLDEAMHGRIRELLLHTLVRHRLVSPAYCLMPDHAHFLWMGTAPGSDQIAAAAFFRRYWNRELRPRDVELQKQGHDHVLHEHERNPDAFEDTVHYVLKNPERAGLVEDWREWRNLGGAGTRLSRHRPAGGRMAGALLENPSRGGEEACGARCVALGGATFT